MANLQKLAELTVLVATSHSLYVILFTEPVSGRTRAIACDFGGYTVHFNGLVRRKESSPNSWVSDDGRFELEYKGMPPTAFGVTIDGSAQTPVDLNGPSPRVGTPSVVVNIAKESWEHTTSATDYEAVPCV